MGTWGIIFPSKTIHYAQDKFEMTEKHVMHPCNYLMILFCKHGIAETMVTCDYFE